MQFCAQLVNDKPCTRVKSMEDRVGKSKVLERAFRLVHLKGERHITSLVAVVVKQRMGAHETVVDLLDVIKPKVSKLRERHDALPHIRVIKVLERILPYSCLVLL